MTAEEIRQEMASSDMGEVIKIIESLDEKSRVLARTYMSALVDRQQLEKAKLTTVSITCATLNL